MSVSIRRAHAEDAPALTHLMHRSKAYEGFYQPIIDGYVVTAAQVQADHIYLAEQDSVILGFYSLVGEVPTAELALLFVDNEAQGLGLGTTLFQHMQQLSAQLGASQVKIIAHPQAEGFYLRQGAQRVGTDPPFGKVTWERPILSLPPV